MGFLDDLSEKAKKGLDIAGEKTNELVDTAKIKYEIAGINSDLGKAYEKLGRLVYQSEKSGEDCRQQVSEITAQIDDLRDRLSDAQDRLVKEK